jgi:hypothetical protein
MPEDEPIPLNCPHCPRPLRYLSETAERFPLYVCVQHGWFTTNTYSMRKVAVTTTKKSLAITDRVVSDERAPGLRARARPRRSRHHVSPHRPR